MPVPTIPATPTRWLISAPSFITQASNGQDEDSFLDLTLIGADAPVQARRVSLNRGRFSSLLKVLYRQLSRQEPLAVHDPASPSRQLHALLVAPILESLQGQDVETLLIAADQGLQAVPFAALSDGTSFFGEKYAFALTPSLALTPLAPSRSSSGVSSHWGLLNLKPWRRCRLCLRNWNSWMLPRVLIDISTTTFHPRHC